MCIGCDGRAVLHWHRQCLTARRDHPRAWLRHHGPCLKHTPLHVSVHACHRPAPMPSIGRPSRCHRSNSMRAIINGAITHVFPHVHTHALHTVFSGRHRGCCPTARHISRHMSTHMSTHTSTHMSMHRPTPRPCLHCPATLSANFPSRTARRSPGHRCRTHISRYTRVRTHLYLCPYARRSSIVGMHVNALWRHGQALWP